jgi:20S proteasome alpha/beta subunit
LVLGGYDKIADKPTLYWIDYLASLAPVPYAAHGYAQYVTLASYKIFLFETMFRMLVFAFEL